MRLGIDPKIDYAFKRMCGIPETIQILISLLESILAFKISGLLILNPSIEKSHVDDKLSILDVKAQDASGRLYNIEVQLMGFRDLLPRFLFYWSKLYSSQLNEGDKYNKLCQTISIYLVNGTLVSDSQDYHHRIELRNLTTNRPFCDHLEMHLIEIPKFRKNLGQLSDSMDQWIYFFKHAQNLDPASPPPELTLPAISQALKELYNMSQISVERERYEARLKAQLDENSVQDWLDQLREEVVREVREKGLEEGREKGLEEGREKGLEEGREVGREEGRAEILSETNEKISTISEILQRHSARQEALPKLEELMKLTVEQLRLVLRKLD